MNANANLKCEGKEKCLLVGMSTQLNKKKQIENSFKNSRGWGSSDYNKL